MIPKTNELRIETSTQCSFHCLMCPRDSLIRKLENMPFSVFEQIVAKTVAEIPQVNIITFSGFGEFSMDPNWKEKVKLASEFFPSIHVLTNLSQFTESDLFVLLDHVTTIRISVYGLSAATYARIHRHSANTHFDAINAHIETLINHKQNHQKIILNHIVLEENRDELPGWIKQWEPKVDRIEVWEPHNWVDGKHYRERCAHTIKTCGRPFNGPIQVQVDGTLNVCCFDYNGKMIIGDLTSQNYTEIFNGPEISLIRELHRNGNADSLELCSICDQRVCDTCKSAHMLYSSEMSPKQRVSVTSTAFEILNRH